MTTAAFILGLIGTLTGCAALYIQWLAYQRDNAKLRTEAIRIEQASEPLFNWLGGGANHASLINRLQVYREFSNEGGAVTDLEIKVKGDAEAAVIPKGHIGEKCHGKIELSKPGVNAMPELYFEISYVTRLNKRSKQSFVWPPNAAPKRINEIVTK